MLMLLSERKHKHPAMADQDPPYDSKNTPQANHPALADPDPPYNSQP
jgi:hypothetical protein